MIKLEGKEAIITGASKGVHGDMYHKLSNQVNFPRLNYVKNME